MVGAGEDAGAAELQHGGVGGVRQDRDLIDGRQGDVCRGQGLVQQFHKLPPPNGVLVRMNIDPQGIKTACIVQGLCQRFVGRVIPGLVRRRLLQGAVSSGEQVVQPGTDGDDVCSRQRTGGVEAAVGAALHQPGLADGLDGVFTPDTGHVREGGSLLDLGHQPVVALRRCGGKGAEEQGQCQKQSGETALDHEKSTPDCIF